MSTINSVGVGLVGTSGTGNFVGTNTPSLITPTLGAATATSINFGGGDLNTYVARTPYTPTFSCDSPGDLSVVYTTQVGEYDQIGNIVTYNILLIFIPTFTTAIGNLRLGLPVNVANLTNYVPTGTGRIGPATYPAGTTFLSSNPIINTNYFNIVGNGSGVAQAVLTMSNLSSGQSYSAAAVGFYWFS